MAWIFSLWAQCSTQEEARAFVDHFARFSVIIDEVTRVDAETSVEAGTCCWVRPTNVSRVGSFWHRRNGPSAKLRPIYQKIRQNRRNVMEMELSSVSIPPPTRK